jgi:hypothetical protein
MGFCKCQKDKKDDIDPVMNLVLLLAAPDLRQGRRAHASRVMSLPKVVLFPSCNIQPVERSLQEANPIFIVFQNIDPPSLSPLGECVLPAFVVGGGQTRRAEKGMGGQYFGRR